jgi:hypothetical protein
MRRAAQRWSRRDGGRGGGGGLGGGAGFTASAACTTSAATSVFSERADAIPNASRPVALRAACTIKSAGQVTFRTVSRSTVPPAFAMASVTACSGR